MAFTGDCVRWSRAKNPNGYGVDYFEGKPMYAHRVAYCKHHGISSDAIKGKVIRHKCDVRDCVNPEHLEIGTHLDNMRDMDERGRRVCGSKHKNAKLTERDVAKIKKICVPRDKNLGCLALSKKYGVSKSLISRIVLGFVWKQIEPESSGG